MPKNPKLIVFHTFAATWPVGTSNEEKRASIKRSHLNRGFVDIGYNALLFRDGGFLEGRDRDLDGDVWEEVGAHVKGWNSKAIGIGMEPIKVDHGEAFGNPWDYFTKETLLAGQDMARHLVGKFPSIERIAGHNEFAAKACPQFQVPDWWDPQTLSWRRSRNAPGEPMAPPPPPSSILSRAEWKEVQSLLEFEGFDPRGIDGIRGPNTNKALMDWALREIRYQLDI